MLMYKINITKTPPFPNIKKGLDRTAKTLNLLHNLLVNLRLIRTDSGNLYPEQMSL